MTTTETELRPATTRYVNGQTYPAARVKVDGWMPTVIEEGRGVAEWGEPAFCEWAMTLLDDDPERIDQWHEVAAEDGWRDAEEEARERFGSGVKVWGDGRSGGWLYVVGLRDVAEWGDPEGWPCATEDAEGYPCDRRAADWCHTGVARCFWCYRETEDVREGVAYCPAGCSPTYLGDPCPSFASDPEAVELHREWTDYATWCQDRANETVADAVWLLWANEWSPDQDRRADLRERFAHLPGLPVAGVPR